MTDRTLTIALVGAMSPIGEQLLSLLAERDFPVGEIHVLDEDRYLGQKRVFGSKTLPVDGLEGFDFSGVQIAFFAIGEAFSAEYAPQAVAAGCVVIDLSPQFGLEENVPLVIPEVNPHRVAEYERRGIIASPTGPIIPMLVAIQPIHSAVGVERINVCTYQAVSGSGSEAVEGLAREAALLLNGKPVTEPVYSKQIAFNVLPLIGTVLDGGYTDEELRMVAETRKILEDDVIQINPTMVRVPVFFGDSAVLHLETVEKMSAEQVKKLLRKAPGVTVKNGQKEYACPTPVTEAVGQDEVFVGRIRENLFHPHGLDLWVVTDTVRKGAALNGVQIAEILEKKYL